MPDNLISRAASALVSNVAGHLGSSPPDSAEVLLLPGEIKALLDPPLRELGFPLQINNIKDTSRQVRKHYRAPVQGGYMAWLYMSGRQLENGANSNDWAWLGLAFGDNGALGLFILSDSDRIALSFDFMARIWENRSGLKRVHFFPAEFTTTLEQSDAGERITLIKNYIGGSTFQVALTSAQKSTQVGDNDKERVVSILSTQAIAAIVKEDEYFRDLVKRTNWPPVLKGRVAGFTGDAIIDARKLVEFAIAQQEHPNLAGYTILGSLIEKLRDDVGASERQELLELIIKYSLITDQAALNALEPTISQENPKRSAKEHHDGF